MSAPVAGRASRSGLAFILMTVALDVLSLGVTLPVLPRLVSQMGTTSLEQGAVIFGWFMTTWHATHLFAAPVLGALADRFGRRPVILLSCLGLSLDYALMAFAPNLTLLFVGRLISGITAATFSVAAAYVADVTPPERRAAGYGALSAAFSAGFIFGPALGGFLGHYDLRLPFYVAGGLSLVNTAYGYFVLPESLPKERRLPLRWGALNPFGAFLLLLKRRDRRVLAGVALLNLAASQVFQSTMVIYASWRYEWSSRQVGVLLAVSALVGALVQSLGTRRMVDRFGERAALRVGLVGGIASFVLIGLTGSPALAVVGFLANSIGGFARPAIQSMMSRTAADGEQGRLNGAMTSLSGIAGIVTPSLFAGALAWGASAGRLPGAPFLLAATFLLFALAVITFAVRPRPG